MKIVILGSAGFIPTSNKESMSVLVVTDNQNAILFDAGTGVKNLACKAAKEILKDISTLNIIFSHLHHDHIAGLTWLLRLWKGKLNVHVPSIPLVEFDGVKSLDILTDAPFFGLKITKWPSISKIQSIQETKFTIGNDLIKVIAQPHSSGSLGFRLGDFAYITDTSPSKEHVKFLSKCKIVLMDTMHNKADYERQYKKSQPQHGHSIGNAEIAQEADIGKLFLVHIDPMYSQSKIDTILDETKEVFQSTFIPAEQSVYEI